MEISDQFHAPSAFIHITVRWMLDMSQDQSEQKNVLRAENRTWAVSMFLSILKMCPHQQAIDFGFVFPRSNYRH
jgi:hypothetical protein